MPGVEFREFQRALVDAFDAFDLTALARFHLNLNLREIVAAGPTNQMAFELLEWAERQGSPIVVDLARGVYLERPRNRKVRQIYEKLGLSPQLAYQRAGVAVADSPEWTTSSSLEALVSPRLHFIDMGIWHENMARIERQVCRIELDGEPTGTGFLVGPELVLTNYHVLEPLIEGNASPSRTVCRFDYKVLSDGSVLEGVAIRLHDSAWRVDLSRYSRAEANGDPDRELPAADELDYALIRLAAPVGAAPVGKSSGSPRRGWITIPEASATIEPGQPLAIVQHPNGAPIKLALDTNGVIGLNANGTRLRYATNTDRGSSGSPCFNIDWRLMALHHMGDPAWKSPKFNQGIPIAAIRQRLVGNVELRSR